jgi:hypothetical protein
MEKCKKIQEAVQNEIASTESHRIGKITSDRSRPLFVKCENLDGRMSILRSAKKLAHLSKGSEFAAFSIQPNRTRLQQNGNRRLVAELKTMRGNGEKVILRGVTILDVDQNAEQ